MITAWDQVEAVGGRQRGYAAVTPFRVSGVLQQKRSAEEEEEEEEEARSCLTKSEERGHLFGISLGQFAGE